MFLVPLCVFHVSVVGELLTEIQILSESLVFRNSSDYGNLELPEFGPNQKFRTVNRLMVN